MSSDHGNIMLETIARSGKNPRVVDIAMLGAHDALTAGIGPRAPFDPNNPDITFLRRNALLRFFAKGMIARLAKTQVSSAYALARHGVRFFDIRASLVDGTWYAAHALLAQPLEECLRDFRRFLQETEGEVLVLSFYAEAQGEEDSLMRWVHDYFFGYVRYDASKIPLGDLRFSDATQGGSGAVILYEHPEEAHGPWHNTNNSKTLLRKVAAENEKLKAEMGKRAGRFRWTQTQLTAQTAFPAILRTVTDWSLLRMAHRLNYRLLAGLPGWLPQMPVFSVDYADNTNHDFNDRAIAIINAHNRRLT